MSVAAGTVHGTALVIGEDGILLRGAPGSGKSSLARELVAAARQLGRHGALVADDRVVLSGAHGRLLARPVRAGEGLLEIRGIGIVRVPFGEAAIIRLVVDLDEGSARMPQEDAGRVELDGVFLPRIAVCRSGAAGVVLWRLGNLADGFVTIS